ncbi:MAG: hypothetical protein UX13_C0038G0012 [Candidatus Woesebacteria bacterium GW2011_GWB1_45_5]|uniref:Uncharacterized protein n=1 Tax=Candidatus Woesebacteria bacterium GW2011_GWB1_45_5 TaxID=1618581 RepID=A0A0G1QLI9_9BACT|nr:MAG: hypothetical protein UX13_C0038G0012 [Candidatus Woesebacteria bacterium GW2011_GWB1_45_5]
MTGLTQVAISARKTIRYIIYVIIFLMVGKVLLDATIGIYKKIFPPAPPPPTVKFGKLPAVLFPDTNPSVKLSYVLETPGGGLPKLPTQVKVFFMPKINPTLLALDVAKEKARALRFTSEPQQISDTVYRFVNPDVPSAFEINIVTGVFSISYDLIADRTPLNVKPPAAEVAAAQFRSSLSAAGILPEDLAGPTSNEFFKLSDGRLESALSLSEADVTKVNLYRKSYDNLPSLTGDPDEANVWAIISGSTNRGQQIVAAEYHYFPVDESQFSTYPIKTAEEAFNELSAGQAFITNLGLAKDGTTLKIRRVYLAYFDPETPTDFFQPIFVFEGDNSFTAYVPAVSADYYGE